jgi:hypothetical protein
MRRDDDPEPMTWRRRLQTTAARSRASDRRGFAVNACLCTRADRAIVA